MNKNTLMGVILVSAIGTVNAQSSLIVYGVVDMGLVIERNGIPALGDSNTTLRLDSGVAERSRFGIKGREEINKSMSALFQVEAGFHVDDGVSADKSVSGETGKLFGNQAFVGLDGDWGALTAGRQYTVYENVLTELDPFRNGLAGRAYNLVGSAGNSYSGGYVRRIDNALQYRTPTMYGFTITGQYGFGEHAGDYKRGETVGVSVNYEYDRLMVYAAYQYNRDVPNKLFKANTPNNYYSFAHNAQLTLIGATYAFDKIKVHAAFSNNRRPSLQKKYPIETETGLFIQHEKFDNQDFLLGMTISDDPHTFMLSYIKKQDKSGSNGTSTQVALGYQYALSKRTDIYASLANIHHNAALVDGSYNRGYSVGNASNPGSGKQAMNIGITHRF